MIDLRVLELDLRFMDRDVGFDGRRWAWRRQTVATVTKEHRRQARRRTAAMVVGEGFNVHRLVRHGGSQDLEGGVQPWRVEK